MIKYHMINILSLTYKEFLQIPKENTNRKKMEKKKDSGE